MAALATGNRLFRAGPPTSLYKKAQIKHQRKSNRQINCKSSRQFSCSCFLPSLKKILIYDKKSNAFVHRRRIVVSHINLRMPPKKAPQQLPTKVNRKLKSVWTNQEKLTLIEKVEKLKSHTKTKSGQNHLATPEISVHTSAAMKYMASCLALQVQGRFQWQKRPDKIWHVCLNGHMANWQASMQKYVSSFSR